MKTIGIFLFLSLNLGLMGNNSSIGLNFTCPQSSGKELVYKNIVSDGVNQYLTMKMSYDGYVNELIYTGPKGGVANLIITMQSKNYLEILFPGGEEVYKLYINGDDMSFVYSNGTAQLYFLTKEGVQSNEFTNESVQPEEISTQDLIKLIGAGIDLINTLSQSNEWEEYTFVYYCSVCGDICKLKGFYKERGDEYWISGDLPTAWLHTHRWEYVKKVKY